jgi:succinate dehydrogenase / fumarate reductase flavoprotein subunit
METTCTRLLVQDGRVQGALAYRRHDGALIVYHAKAVLLASGGLGKIYRVTSNSWESTGDGSAMALNAGALLMDCEMVQFHPTGMVWPPGVRGILVTEGVRGEGGLLFNNKHERFMEKYDPERMELSTRDVVARSINNEVIEGRGSPHGGAFLDISHRPREYILNKLPSMYEQFESLADIDITKEAMEVAPTIHYSMGGVRVQPENGATNIEGLFAAGEVACGLHGANRLGGNSLSDLIVFGKRAGDGAAAYVADGKRQAAVAPGQVSDFIAYTLEPLRQNGQENPYLLHEELQDTLTRYAPIIRDDAGLRIGLAKVKELQERAAKVGTGGNGGREFNPGWHAALDLKSMIDNAEGVFLCAIERRESRGAHTRRDYPELDPELGELNFVVQKRGEDQELDLDSIQKEPIPPDYQEIIDSTWTRDYTRED